MEKQSTTFTVTYTQYYEIKFMKLYHTVDGYRIYV